MNKQQNEKGYKIRVYLIIVALVATITTVISCLGAFIAYPTQAHRDVARQFNTLNAQASQGGTDINKLVNSEEYKSLQSSSEMQYSLRTGAILAIVQLVLTIVMIGIIYNYLRRRRLAGNISAGITAWLYVFGSLLAAIASSYFSGLFVMNRSPQFVELLAASLATLTMGLALAYLIARIFQWRYERNHSFVVE